jgi:hypothetical protein
LIELALKNQFVQIKNPKYNPYPFKALKKAGSDIPLFFNVSPAMSEFHHNDQLMKNWEKVSEIQGQKTGIETYVYDLFVRNENSYDDSKMDLADFFKLGEQPQKRNVTQKIIFRAFFTALLFPQEIV